MGKKGGKKAKGPTYYVEDDTASLTGSAPMIFQKPPPATGTVGRQYENPEDRSTGRLWVGGHTVLVHGGRGGSLTRPRRASRDSKRLALPSDDHTLAFNTLFRPIIKFFRAASHIITAARDTTSKFICVVL